MEVIGHNTNPDWPKLGPSMLIAAVMLVAIRTVKWKAVAPCAGLSDHDQELDKEIDFAIRVTNRLLHAFLKKHPSAFPQKKEYIYAPDEDSPP